MAILRALKRAVRRSLPDGLLHMRAMRNNDEPLLPILAAYVRGGVFIDVGANQGLFTHFLRKEAVRVVAFEPVKSLAASLQRRYPDVEVHACALSDAAGEADLHIPSQDREQVLPRASLNADANPGFSLTPVVVPVKRLDDFGFRDVAAIKIDVEGHEENVLKGALQTIFATHPALVVEIEERHHAGRSVSLMRRIEALGYTSYYHDGRGLRPAKDFNFAVFQAPDRQKDVFGRVSSEYVNNFLFLQKDLVPALSVH